MRPHRLRLTAFGPFADTVTVDLDALAASGLFLLHGETGAGKTTLLDGVGFALFGRVPGVRGEAKRLRSDHAAAATRTEVQLEVTLGGRRMRVTRSPEQQRPKQRGEGLTKEPAKVLLEEHDGSVWRAVSTRVGEADRELADLVGMSAEQFFQVVLLPQGDFARFLRAGSDDRAKLLERLFATDRFRAVEQWLVERRRATSAARDAAGDAVARLVARVAQVAGVDEPEQVPPGWAEALAASAAEQARAASDDALRHQAALDQALAADEEARALAERQARRRAALDQQEALTADAPAVAALERELDAARRAAEVGAALDDARQRAAALQAAGAALATARQALPAELRDADVDVLRAARQSAAERVGRLDAVRGDAERAAAEEAGAHEALATAAAAEAEQRRLRAALDSVPARREAALARRAACQNAAVRLPAVRALAEQRRAEASDAAALAAARDELALLRDQHLLAREAAAGARETAAALREARIDAIVAELSATLVDDTPCPVCGSLDHPDPSEVRGERVSRDDEEAASALADRLRSTAEAIGAQVASVAASCDALTVRVGRSDPADLVAQADALEAEAASLHAVAAEMDAADRALGELDADVTAMRAELAAVEAELQVARAEAAAAEQRAAAARAVVAQHLEGEADLAAALDAARAATAQLDAALLACERLEQAAAESDRAGHTARRKARAAGFDGADDAEQARRDSDWRAEAEARCAAHRDAVLAVTAVLAEPALDVPLEPAADVTATGARVAAERVAHAAAAQEAGRLGDRARQLAELVPALQGALAELEPLAARAAEVRALADLAAGQGANTLRMTLSSYVLAARLEEVAAAASERLLRMTQGRYSLVHTDTGRGNAKAGLGLLARDAWTGQDRDTSTLSGGETFLASLALALGLADVVAAEAGGAQTEALFVDEGFGTLDEETLEEVMDVLDGLREGGRVVGVVSHVTELRQRIPAQVHVRKGRAGSEVRLIGC